MDRTVLLITMVVLATTVTLVSVLQESCTSSLYPCHEYPSCRCCHLKFSQVVADCSYLGISKIPSFGSNVVEIDFSHNNLSKIQTRNGSNENVVILDISFNNLGFITKNAFTNFRNLRELSLTGNNLSYLGSGLYPGVFKDLTKLEFLNLGKNTHFSDKAQNVYPAEVFKDLPSLESLKLDGLESPIFEPPFKTLSNLTELDISGSKGYCFTKYIKSDTFVNLPYLQSLDVSKCHLVEIHSGALRPLASLQYLDFSTNKHLTFDVLPNVTCDIPFTSVRVVKCRELYCTYGIGTYLRKTDIECLKNTSIEEIYFDGNRLESVEEGVVTSLPKSLSFLSVVDNKFTMGKYLFEVMALSNVTTFDGSKQFYSHDPLKKSNGVFSCVNEIPSSHTYQRHVGRKSDEHYKYESESIGTSIFRRVGYSFTFDIPHKIETLYFNQTGIRDDVPKFGINAKNSIKHADFSNNIFPSLIGPIIGLHRLEYLDISSCLSAKIGDMFFGEFPSLKTLKMQSNYLGGSFANDSNGRIFKSLQNLESLDLSWNQISGLSKSFFIGLPNLKELYLQGNSLSEFDVDIQHISNLSKLTLSSNKLASLTREFRNSIDMLLPKTNIMIDMGDNQIQCTCNNLEFLRWLSDKRANFKNFLEYRCQLSNLTVISFLNFDNDLRLLQKQCASYVGVMAASLVGITFFLSILVGSLVYRYRWKLRYMYYMIHNKYRRYTPLVGMDDSDQFIYDAFISHADEDKSFAVTEMSEHLESRGGLKLCIANRDFKPGSQIAANIAYAISKSRTTVIILSKHFLNSYWCMYELNMARMEGIYTRNAQDVVFMVMYQPVSTRHLPHTVLELIDNESYIEYPNDEMGNTIFWDKMRESLKR